MSQDQLWYKDAIIYELHVRAFHDSVGDGTGDFNGLTQKLDYLQDLGVTALWLLPFYPSPLRDDGYDIADYTDVNPDYGTLAAFKDFLAAAHRRGLRVITELVLNHTSDQHAWFQRARRAPKGSSERDFYVWSEAPDKYLDARIIFKDFETSNWSYDNVAKAYYWHRFYSHQPDLNFDNPEVWKAIIPIVDYWFEMGVDGMRLDAVPYLFEREGTNCENLPETHAFLKTLRKHVDDKFPGRMLLAEANQWPEDAAAYYGDGDECQMCFHFPLMPRLFMAVHTEDRFPVVDILRQTPAIPESCQWAVFLRNHDELTLEMVTDEERDYMYRAYAQDQRARINLGIRHRLAPLMGNNRRRCELLTALLFSLPGTPVLYYGDEIGMGDNIYLGDRNGVRTPMQWSSDRNAGFSRANPQKLYLPVIIDPEYHYEAVNVEAQQGNPSSLLWWHKRLINLRKEHPAFSRGEIRFLDPHNRKILTFVREFGNDRVLVVANLSRYSQYVELDLPEFVGMRPIECFGGTPFPEIGGQSYTLALGPHAFYWFSLESAQQTQAAVTPELSLRSSWEDIFQPEQSHRLNALLQDYFEAESPAHSVRAATVRDAFRISTDDRPAWALLVTIETGTSTESRALTLIHSTEDEQANWRPGYHPPLFARLAPPLGGVIHLAAANPELHRAALAMITQATLLPGRAGELVGRHFGQISASDLSPDSSIVATRSETTQNRSVKYGDRWVLKLYRQIEEGIHPEIEIGNLLAMRSANSAAESEPGREKLEVQTAPLAPRLLGALEYRRRKADPAVLGVLHQWVPHESDAWRYTLDVAAAYLEQMAAQSIPAPQGPWPVPDGEEHAISRDARQWFGDFLEKAKRIGSRLAELHAVLASSELPAFAPEPFSMQYQRSVYQSMRRNAIDLTGLLKNRLGALASDLQPLAKQVIAKHEMVLDELRLLLERPFESMRIRSHGDCDLAHLLFTGNDFTFFDFAGRPHVSLGERRLKRSPLRDVAHLLRSFDHAIQSTLLGLSKGGAQPEGNIRDIDRLALQPWADYWTYEVGNSMISGYRTDAAVAELLPQDRDGCTQLTRLFLTDTMISEALHELQINSSWLQIPLTAILKHLL